MKRNPFSLGIFTWIRFINPFAIAKKGKFSKSCTKKVQSSALFHFTVKQWVVRKYTEQSTRAIARFIILWSDQNFWTHCSSNRIRSRLAREKCHSLYPFIHIPLKTTRFNTFWTLGIWPRFCSGVENYGIELPPINYWKCWNLIKWSKTVFFHNKSRQQKKFLEVVISLNMATKKSFFENISAQISTREQESYIQYFYWITPSN